MVAVPRALAAFASTFGSWIPGPRGHCNLTGVAIPLSPAQQTALGSPTTPLSAVGLGFGVQNYTCSSSNVFVSAGAVAEVLDISSLASSHSPRLTTIQNDLYSAWNSSLAGNTTIQELIATLPTVIPPQLILCQHYFASNSAGGISPEWDFRATPQFTGNENAVFVGKALTNTSGSNPAVDVPWLHLGKVSGNISDEIYRIETVGGVAPSSCVNGTTISVKYVSQYWFFGGSLGLGSR